MLRISRVPGGRTSVSGGGDAEAVMVICSAFSSWIRGSRPQIWTPENTVTIQNLVLAVGECDLVHDVLIVISIDDGGRCVGVRGRLDAFHNGVVEHVRGGAADIQAGDEQGGFEAGRLSSGLRAAGFVSTQADGDDVIGAHAGGAESVESAEHAFIVAA